MSFELYDIDCLPNSKSFAVLNKILFVRVVCGMNFIKFILYLVECSTKLPNHFSLNLMHYAQQTAISLFDIFFIHSFYLQRVNESVSLSTKLLIKCQRSSGAKKQAEQAEGRGIIYGCCEVSAYFIICSRTARTSSLH